MVTQQARTILPKTYGDWQAYGYLNSIDGTEHMALALGDLTDGEDVLIRVHSECLTGDVFGSLRCDCGAQLEAAMALIAAEGRGVVLTCAARGPRHRAARQAAGRPAPGPRLRHGGREPGARPAGGRARLHHRGAILADLGVGRCGC